MFCPKCGQQLEDNSSFCRYCGNMIEQSNQEAFPQQEMYATQDFVQYETEEYEQKKSGVSALTHVAAILLCILLFIVLLAGTLVLTIRRSTTEESISDVVKEINLADIRLDGVVSDADEDVTLVEYIHDNIDEDLIDKYHLSESNIEELLEEDSIQEFIADKVSEYCDYIYSGGSEPKVTAKEVVKLLQKNEKSIYKITGYQLTDSDYDEIKNSLDDGQLDALDMSNIGSEYDDTLTAVKWGLSYGCLAGLSVIGLVFCVLIFVLYRHRIASAFLCIGVTTTLVGVGELITGLFSGTLITALCESFSLPRQAVRPIVEEVSACFSQIAAIVTRVGVALIVIHIIIKICIKKLRKSEED